MERKMMPENKERHPIPERKTRLSPAEAFMLFVEELGGGNAVKEWGEDLREIVEAVRTTGNPGELNIKLKFELLDAEGFGRVSVMDTTKSKRPRHSHDPTTYIITADAALAVVPPEQMKMDGLN